MEIPRMIAIGDIYRSTGHSRAIGEDATGAPVFETIPEIIRHGTGFTPRDEEEMRWLLEAGACREAQPGEERLARDLAATDPDEEEPLDAPVMMMTRPGPTPRDRVAEAEEEEEDDA